jgi:hypothetical protein
VGADVFRISLGTGLDIVSDFATGDKLDLTAYGFTAVASFAQTVIGGDLRITLSGGNVVVLIGRTTLLVDGDLGP